MKRRTFLGTAAAAFAGAQSSNVPEAIRNLKPMTAGVQPITDEESAGPHRESATPDAREQARRGLHGIRFQHVLLHRHPARWRQRAHPARG